MSRTSCIWKRALCDWRLKFVIESFFSCNFPRFPGFTQALHDKVIDFLRYFNVFIHDLSWNEACLKKQGLQTLLTIKYPFKKLKYMPYSFFFIIYFWLCWVFVSVWGLSLVAASGGHSSSRCAGLSLLRPLLLRSTGSRRAGSVVVAHGPSCIAACGIFPDQGSNPCPLRWQADSQPLCHQGSPMPYS